MVIQLLGKKRSGKDYTAEQLKKQFEGLGKTVEILSYAEPIKEILSGTLDVGLNELDTFKNYPYLYELAIWQNNEAGYTVSLKNGINFRDVLKRFGDSMKNIFGEDVFAKRALDKVNNSEADIIIISDCRYKVELETVGGYTVRVVNNTLKDKDTHSSETELLEYDTDFSIDNTDYDASISDYVDLTYELIKKEIKMEEQENKVYQTVARLGSTGEEEDMLRAEVKFAYATGHTYIEDADGMLCKIIDEHTIECDEQMFENVLTEEEIEDVLEDVEEAPRHIDNIRAIDEVINNTLSQEVKLTAESCDNMLKLAQLRLMLQEH